MFLSMGVVVEQCFFVFVSIMEVKFSDNLFSRTNKMNFKKVMDIGL